MSTGKRGVSRRANGFVAQNILISFMNPVINKEKRDMRRTGFGVIHVGHR
jgi:hypothetical protein